MNSNTDLQIQKVRQKQKNQNVSECYVHNLRINQKVPVSKDWEEDIRDERNKKAAVSFL